LPELPQPTHDFPDSQTLDIKIGIGKEKICPIRSAHGTAAHRSVTIEDAISDLPRFDWYDSLLLPSTESEANLDLGNTLSQRRRNQKSEKKGGNGRPAFLPWSARVRNHIVGFKGRLGISTQRKPDINNGLGRIRQVIFSSTLRLYYLKRLNGMFYPWLMV
jgi:hypothetical protein